MRILLLATFAFCGCSSTEGACMDDCADPGFTVRLPSRLEAATISASCSGPVDPASVVAGSVHIHTTNEGTCHVDVALTDGTHRSGDSSVSYVDRRCCRGPYGTTLDLSM